MERHVSISVSAMTNGLQSHTLFIAESTGMDSGDDLHQM